MVRDSAGSNGRVVRDIGKQMKRERKHGDTETHRSNNGPTR